MSRLSVRPTAKSAVRHRKRGPNPQQPAPDHSSDNINKVRKPRKRSRAESGRREAGERGLDQRGLGKRQRRDIADPRPTHQADSLPFSMTESEPDPITRPNSTLCSLPALAQLHRVNARFEKNPHRREHYSRQFSVTPERQTPESQRTPLIIWPEIDPVEDLKEAKAWAANEAQRLERFHAGRVLLRREEPERYGIFGEDPEYWDSQTSHWKTEYEKLAEEYDRRQQMEAEGKAHEGYAQSLLLSPVQSPSPPPSNGILRVTAAGIKKQRPTATRPSQLTAAKDRMKRSPQLSQLTPLESSNRISKTSNRREHTNKPKEKDVEEEILAQAFPSRKPIRETTNPITKHSSELVTTRASRASRPRTNPWRASKTTKKKAKRQTQTRSMSPQTPRVLPWTLRSRLAVSYRETSISLASKRKGRLGRRRRL